MESIRIFFTMALLAAGVYGYALSGNPMYSYIFLWGGITFSLMLFLFVSESGSKLCSFFAQSYQELSKVVWPSRKETMQLTMAVVILVSFVAIYLAVIDGILRWLLYAVLLGWK